MTHDFIWKKTHKFYNHLEIILQQNYILYNFGVSSNIASGTTVWEFTMYWY